MADKSNIPFFPPPILGETVYSWVCRFHHLSGHRSFTKHTLKLLGLIEGRPSNEFPSYLPNLAVHSGIDLDLIIHQMTSAHYYEPFIAQKDFLRLWESLKSGTTKNAQSITCSIANRITPDLNLYACCDCIKDDIALHGFPIWHIEHQLSGVTACPLHHQHLVTTLRLSSQAELPRVVTSEPSTIIENQFSQLIIDEFMAKPGFLSHSFVIKTYTSKLQEMDLLTEHGQVRLCQLKQLIKHHITSLMDATEAYSWFHHALESVRYPECLFYKKTSNLHPLKHLVFIGTLFTSWNQFIESYYRMYNAPEWPTPPKTIRRRHTPLILSKSAQKRLRQGESLRTVSMSEGISVTSLKVLAQQAHVPVDLRPSKIYPLQERAIWRLLFIGQKTQKIATQFGISVGAVELILRKHPYLKPLRKRIWFYSTRSVYRQQIKTYIKTQPEHPRKDIKQSNYAAFMWLYRHDRGWLYEHLPDRLPATNNRTRKLRRG